MDALNARPRLLKQANLSSIRRFLKSRGTATRAEIAAGTKISTTTVRSLLAEMLQNKEIESVGLDASSGGRKAERYRLQPGRYHGAAFCITGSQAHGLLVNVCGEIVEAGPLPGAGDLEAAIAAYIDGKAGATEIKSIGVGVPGVVEGGGYWRKAGPAGAWTRVDIGERLAARYGVPVVLENDINATAIGAGRCYEKTFPGEGPENINMAYLHFERGCASAGFIAGGRVIRGCKNFAGELGLLPVEGEAALDECLSGGLDDTAYTRLVVKTLCWVCGILNPRYVFLAGPDFRTGCLGAIGDGLYALLPAHLLPELLHSPDVWNDYHLGMASLTASKMFDEVQFIKE